MKKNTMMRLASFLLIAVLISTSAISGTYAKYVTQDSASDSARVAKWGVTFDIEGGPLFSKEYKTDDTANYASMVYSVKSTENVVAPGTEGNLVTFRTMGEPEVSYVVEHTVAAGTEDIFTKKNITYTSATNSYSVEDITDGYYPVVLTLKYNGNKIGGWTKVASLNAAIAKCGYYYDVSTDKYYVMTDGSTYDTTGQDTAPTMEIDWSWAFENNDAYDTTLGNLAAGINDKLAEGNKLTVDADYNLELNVNITATATQID